MYGLAPLMGVAHRLVCKYAAEIHETTHMKSEDSLAPLMRVGRRVHGTDERVHNV